MKHGHDAYRKPFTESYIKDCMTLVSHAALCYTPVSSLPRMSRLGRFHKTAHVNHNLAITVYHGPKYTKATQTHTKNVRLCSPCNLAQAYKFVEKYETTCQTSTLRRCTMRTDLVFTHPVLACSMSILGISCRHPHV
jgi:hypothetical protein